MKQKIDNLIGDFSWQEVCKVLAYRLTTCKTKEEFIKIIEYILLSVGDSKYLAKKRKELGIHSFTKEDKEKIKHETLGQ